MLDTLNIKGAYITPDAMNSQKKEVKKTTDRGGDYTISIKNNHKRLKEEIAAYFHKIKRESSQLMAVHEGHGRVERRICRQLRVTEWISKANEWSGLQTIVEMERERHLPGRLCQREIQYYISSRTTDVAGTAHAIRSHWQVENKVHWVLDVTFGEGDSRIRREDRERMWQLSGVFA